MSNFEDLGHLEHLPDLEDLRHRLIGGLLSVDRLSVKNILTQSYRVHHPVQFVEELVVPALEQIGNGWEKGGYSLSQVYMAGRVCEEVVDLLMPASSEVRHTQPKMAIAVLEDYHLLGKRIVYSILRASGFDLANYGRMSVDELANRVAAEEDLSSRTTMGKFLSRCPKRYYSRFQKLFIPGGAIL
jgi:methanogenic corrinoid protein MtbC1